MTQTIEIVVLRNARDLLSNDSRWTAGAWARDDQGKRCGPLSVRARQWCAWGALQKCAYDLLGHEAVSRDIANRISKKLVPGPGGLIFVNERGGYELVCAVMALGGPPPKAGPTWPFENFRGRQGFGAFARGDIASLTAETDRAHAKKRGVVAVSARVPCPLYS